EAESLVRRAADALAEALTALGSDWDEARLRGFDRTVARVDAAREHQKRLEAAERVLDEAERAHRDAVALAERARAGAERVAAALPGAEPPPLGELDRDEGHLRDLRAAFHAREAAERNREARERAAAAYAVEL